MAKASLGPLALTVCGALLLAAPARADWNAYGGNTEHHFFTTEKLQAPLGVVWKHATSIYAEKAGNKGGPIISEGTAYFPSKNRIYAVDVASGELKWKAPEGDPNDPKIPQITATPVSNGEFVFVPDASGLLTAYNTGDGTMAWQFRTGAAIKSSPILVGSNLYFGSDDDFVYCLNPADGTLRWKSNSRGKEYAMSDDAVGSPVLYNGVLYVNSSDMKLYAFQADSGRVIWESRIAAPSIDISPVAYNGRIYLAGGSTLYQFRLRGGNYRAFPLQEKDESGSFQPINDITTTPIITEKYWFVGDRDGYFRCYNSTGKQAQNAEGKDWKVKLDGRPVGTPVMTPDTIYITTDKGFVYGVDIAKGTVTWTYRTEAPKGMPQDKTFLYYPIRAPLAVSDGKLFILGDDGTLTAMAHDAGDDEGPIMTLPRPSRGAVMNGAPPIYVTSYLWDEGSGINPDTIELLLDGKPIDQDKQPYNVSTGSTPRKGWVYDPVKRIIRYQTPKAEKNQPEQPLINGRHKIQVQAADWAGNFNSMEWSFVVDNSLPRNAVANKAKPKNGANGAPGAPGGYPGGSDGPLGGPGMAGAPGGPGGQGNQFRNRLGGYNYGNRGQNGYGFQGQGNFGPGGRGQGGFRGGSGGSGGRGGFQGNRGNRGRNGFN